MRPIYDLASLFSDHVRTAEEEGCRVYEAVIGVVTDNKDPQKLGRVKVKIPVLSNDDTTYWCPIIMQGAGKNRGWFFIPEPDDEVLILFEHGDMDRPLVVGALWNGKDQPPDANPTGDNAHRVIESRAGSRLLFDDSKKCGVVIEDGAGIGRITLDAANNKIVIEALEGDVCFQTPQGETAIVARSATFDAKQNIEIHAGTAMAWGTDASATVAGGQLVHLAGAQVSCNGGNAVSPPPPIAQPKDVPDPYEGGTFGGSASGAAKPRRDSAGRGSSGAGTSGTGTSGTGTSRGWFPPGYKAPAGDGYMQDNGKRPPGTPPDGVTPVYCNLLDPDHICGTDWYVGNLEPITLPDGRSAFKPLNANPVVATEIAEDYHWEDGMLVPNNR